MKWINLHVINIHKLIYLTFNTHRYLYICSYIVVLFKNNDLLNMSYFPLYVILLQKNNMFFFIVFIKGLFFDMIYMIHVLVCLFILIMAYNETMEYSFFGPIFCLLWSYYYNPLRLLKHSHVAVLPSTKTMYLI
jgi:hypothetical protein